MSLFFPGKIFTPENNLKSLTKTADYLQNFSGISMAKHLYNETKQIQSILLHNSCLSRTINLFYLKLLDLPDSDCAPSNYDIHQSLANVPEKLIRHLSPRISQAFTMLVLKIHKNIKAFVELALKFLSNDNNFIYNFAYSTFPAIFGYFHLDSLCELACDFLLEFINQPHKNFLQRSRSSGSYFSLTDFNWQPLSPVTEHTVNYAIPLISSFFLSMHHFFYYLWTAFESKVIYQPKNVNEMYFYFCDSLDIAADYLTSHHRRILSAYIEVDRNTCVSIMFKNVFAVSLKHHFPELDELYNFFCFLGQNPSSEAVKKLFDILTKPRRYFYSNSNISFTHIQRVPVVMNDKDICNVLDIIDKDKRFASDTFELIQSKGTILTRSYQPFCADIVLTKRKHTNPLFDRYVSSAPCTVSSPILDVFTDNQIDDDEQKDIKDQKEFSRRYLIIQNAALKFGLTELDAIKQVINQDDKHSKYYNAFKPFIDSKTSKFSEYALKQYIQGYKIMDSQINNLLIMKQIVQMLKNFGHSIEIAEKQLLYCYAENYVQQTIEVIESKNKTLIPQQRFIKYFEVIMDSNQTPPFLLVSSCIKLLDGLSVKLGSDVLTIMDKYCKYSQNELATSIAAWADKNPRIACKLVHDVFILRHKINLKYGERVVGLIALMRNLLSVEKELPNIGFQGMFDFVIEEIKPMKIIETMIIMKTFIIQNEYVKEILPKDDFNLFQDLLNAFIEVLRFDPSLQKELQLS